MTDEAEPEDDVLERRLGYAAAALNIFGTLVWVAMLVVAIDEMTGGSLKRDFEHRRELWARRRKARREFNSDAQRVQFEAWLALQEGSDHE